MASQRDAIDFQIRAGRWLKRGSSVHARESPTGAVGSSTKKCVRGGGGEDRWLEGGQLRVAALSQKAGWKISILAVLEVFFLPFLSVPAS